MSRSFYVQAGTVMRTKSVLQIARFQKGFGSSTKRNLCYIRTDFEEKCSIRLPRVIKKFFFDKSYELDKTAAEYRIAAVVQHFSDRL